MKAGVRVPVTNRKTKSSAAAETGAEGPAPSTDEKRAPPMKPKTAKSRQKPAPVPQVVDLPEAKAGNDVSSLVHETVSTLRNLILYRRHENGFLGSEDKMIADLGVSRPTFRQAARLLEHEQLLTIKRGVGGGFFARMPSPETVTHMMSIYLTARGVTLRALTEAGGPLIVEAARLVAANPSRDIRAKLTEYVKEHAGFEERDDLRGHVQVVLGFQDLLSTLCGNPVIELLANTINQIVREPRHGYFKITPERAKVYADYHRRLAAAVLDGDPAIAQIIAQRHVEMILTFLSDSSDHAVAATAQVS